MPPLPNLQIVGFGPAALGLFVAADRQYRLDRLLRSGVVVHERVGSPSEWQSLSYHIEANSSARDFVVGVRPDGCFAPCLDSTQIREWLEDGRRAPTLQEVSAFLRRLVARVADLQRQQPALQVQWGSTVESVHWDGQTFLAQGTCRPAVRSRRLLLACGARPSTVTAARPPAPGRATRVNADVVLRGQAHAEIERAICSGGRIAVLGASHSAFSVVCYLLQRYGDRIGDGGVLIVLGHRTVALWWPSPEAATGLTEADLVDPCTGEVNKFRGLRGAARRMYLAIRDGAERRAALVGEVACDPGGEDTHAPALTICATGYTANVPQITTAGGMGLQLDEYRGVVCKDEPTGELLSEGRPIPGLFGMGIGYADRRGDAFEVGVNLFHGASADRVLHQILG